MLEFVRNAYRKYVGTFLWINLFLSMVLGLAAGYYLSNGNNEMIFQIVGFIIGSYIGLFSNILIGGKIATILNIDKNIELLRGSNSGKINTLSEE